MRYSHYRDADGGQWYGFYEGDRFAWLRRHGGRWWWREPGQSRWLYYQVGYWWWQDPARTQDVYVYVDGTYAAYDEQHPPQVSLVASDEASGGELEPRYTLARGEDPESLSVPAAPRYDSDVDAPSYEAPARPDDAALVFGVEDYGGAPKADFAARDADAVHAHLLKLGYPERNIAVLVNGQATLAALQKYVEAWLPELRQARLARLLLLLGPRRGPTPQTGKTYLVPADGDPKSLSATALPRRALLYEKLNATAAPEIIVALDACFAGGGRSLVAAGTRPLVTKVDTARGSTGRAVVFAATGASEITGTLPRAGPRPLHVLLPQGLDRPGAHRRDGRDGPRPLLLPPPPGRGGGAPRRPRPDAGPGGSPDSRIAPGCSSRT